VGATVEIEVPDGAVSGIYAATFERDRDRLVVPFVVTAPRRDADVCVLIPTLTWQAYSSNRGPWSYTEDGLVDATPCIYDQHRDGSMVYYVSRRRPTRSHNPAAGFPVWGAHNVTANLYLIDWLEHEGISYVLTTDEELHREGTEVFASSRCLIIGSHPEYWTAQMLEALGAHLRGGGRCLYLGGNGLFWVTSFDPARPYIIEVRKSGDWLDWWAHPTPGEFAHSTTLEAGGLWSRRGRPARRLIGVEMAANCVTLPDAERPRGFRRLPASHAPEFAFAFRGVGDEVIGSFGLNLGSAASYEMDAALELDGSEAIERTVLAEAADPAFIPLDRIPVRPRSDLALTTYPGGGAVFAAGSVTWTGSLSHNNYANNVSLVTGNVLRHFLAVPRGQSVLGELAPARFWGRGVIGQKPIALQLRPEPRRDFHVEHSEVVAELVHGSHAEDDASDGGVRERELQRRGPQRHVEAVAMPGDPLNPGSHLVICGQVVEPPVRDRQNPAVEYAADDHACPAFGAQGQ